MCGIADLSLEAVAAAVHRMIALPTPARTGRPRFLRYSRGFVGPLCRLAIIDLSDGRRPKPLELLGDNNKVGWWLESRPGLVFESTDILRSPLRSADAVKVRGDLG
jgi:hypothetical protein